MAEKELLSFEEFSEGDTLPTYNNFFLHFVTVGVEGETYRSKPHFKRFSKEHPILEQSLTKKIMDVVDLPDRRDKTRLLEKDLYEAYKIMRQYVDSDEELFS